MSKFDKEIGRSLFRDIKGICRARTYEPLINLYTLAKEHNLQKKEFFGSKGQLQDFNRYFEGTAY